MKKVNSIIKIYHMYKIFFQESKREERKKLADEDALRKIKHLEEQAYQLQKQVATHKQARIILMSKARDFPCEHIPCPSFSANISFLFTHTFFIFVNFYLSKLTHYHNPFRECVGRRKRPYWMKWKWQDRPLKICRSRTLALFSNWERKMMRISN